MTLTGKKILLIIGGGVAAYKALDLSRRLMERGASVRGVLTKAGSEFITPMSVASLTGDQCFTDLFDLKDEAEMGHIRLSREADLVLIAPATADLMAKMAAGLANDLASTLLLATDKPVMVAPAMNAQMWAHKATQRNIATLKADGIRFVDPESGMLACGEVGPGRLADVMTIVGAVEQFFAATPMPLAGVSTTAQAAAQAADIIESANAAMRPLAGRRIVITAGPTHEKIDPVRYIANRSSGKQGYAIAAAAARLGADVVLVSGPTALTPPVGVTFVPIESALEMQDAVHAALPADAFIAVAAVADWRVDGAADRKLKKSKDGLPQLCLVENPDILKGVSHMDLGRPSLVVGFAAETDTVLDHARAKRLRKGCDWIVANDVAVGALGEGSVMGGNDNQVNLITPDAEEAWPPMHKDMVADTLVRRIADALTSKPARTGASASANA